MENQSKNTVILTNKSVVPHRFSSILDDIFSKSKCVVKKMLEDRTLSSSKYYKELPCVVSKSLIAKYQKNKKCKSVRNLVIPICGDKGRQVKLESSNSIRIPSITKKDIIEIYPSKEISGEILSVEFFKKKKKWFVSYSYNVDTQEVKTNGFVGVDRNARDNVATICDLESGKVKRLGPDIKLWKDNFKKRKAKIQRCGKRKFLKKIKRKQSNRTKDINHKVSKKIVDYAAKHRKTIILENLSKIKNSKKCGKFVKKSNWAYAQLETFIRYKSSLRGIPVLSIDPAFSSKECSKCGSINDVNGKRFVCKKCGHEDHRDSNAGFNIASRGKKLFFDGIGESVKKSYGVISDNERELSAGHIDVPLS